MISIDEERFLELLKKIIDDRIDEKLKIMDDLSNKQEDLITPEMAAGVLGVKVKTLEVWRSSRRYNLSYVKIGGNVRYRMKDINNFIASRTHMSIDDE